MNAIHKKIIVLFALCCFNWQLHPMISDVDAEQRKVIEFCVNMSVLGCCVKLQQSMSVTTLEGQRELEQLDELLEIIKNCLNYMNVSNATVTEIEGVWGSFLSHLTIEDKIECLKANINTIYLENAQTINYELENAFASLGIR